jgi:hypothetical protein
MKRPTERIREAPAAQVKPLYRDRSFLQCESRRSLSADARVHLPAVGSAFDGSKVELNGWLGSGVRSFDDDDDDDDGSSTSAQASARHHRKRSQQLSSTSLKLSLQPALCSVVVGTIVDATGELRAAVSPLAVGD